MKLIFTLFILTIFGAASFLLPRGILRDIKSRLVADPTEVPAEINPAQNQPHRESGNFLDADSDKKKAPRVAPSKTVRKPEGSLVWNDTTQVPPPAPPKEKITKTFSPEELEHLPSQHESSEPDESQELDVEPEPEQKNDLLQDYINLLDSQGETTGPVQHDPEERPSSTSDPEPESPPATDPILDGYLELLNK